MELATLLSAPRSAIGLELTWLDSERWSVRVCRLQRTGATVTVEQQLTDLTDLPALAAALGAESGPLALVITGRGLILRALPDSQGAPTALQLAGLLPGADLRDFYYQHIPTQAGNLVALIRRAPLEALLAAFAAIDLWVLEVQLGPLGAVALLPYLPTESRLEPLAAGPYLLTLAPEGACLAAALAPIPAELPDRKYTLGDDRIASRQLLAYAAALGLLAGESVASRSPALPSLRERQGEWRQRRWFHRLRLIIPLGILGLLLLNLLIGQHLQSQQEKLAGTVHGNQQLLARVRSAQRIVGQQEAFLTATGWTQPSLNSLCADRLAATLPAGIQLLVLDINPSQAPLGETSRGPRFRANVVLVKGQCATAQQFNTWLQRLSQQPWAQAVRDQHFAYDYAGGVGTFTFTLLLTPTAFSS